MDVKKLLPLVLSALVFISCDNKDEDPPEQFKQSSAQCQTQEIKNQYILKWKNGKVEQIHAESMHELKAKWTEKYGDKIDYIEASTQLRLPELPEEEIGIRSTTDSWAHTRLETDFAWSQGIKGQGVMVAVIDSGVNVSHQQLSNQIAINHQEIEGNGMDDDHNGLVDDYLGYNFFTRSGAIDDSNGHGTHVAGIIGASHIGNAYPSGMAPEASLLALSFMDSEGRGSTAAAIDAIYYAHARGAKIINASWGSSSCSLALEQAIEDVTNAGVFFVAAAGNSQLNLDYYFSYPTSYGIAGVLNVAATTDRELTASFSNFGSSTVEVAAPGKNIYSTYAYNSYATLSGTSMAAPFVTGLAALALSKNPNLTVAELKNLIMQNVNPGPYPVISRGEISVRKLIEAI